MTPRELWAWAQENGAEDLPMWSVEGDADPRDAWRPLGAYQPPEITGLDPDYWMNATPIYDESREIEIIAL